MKHEHDHCSHENLKYCSHCDVTYCLGCQREWGVNSTYQPYETTATYPPVICDVWGPPATTDTANDSDHTHAHTYDHEDVHTHAHSHA